MKHVVVGIISQKNDQGKEIFLLVRSVLDFGKYSGFYYPPGGHLEEGEDTKEVLKRKIKEEINLEVEPLEEIAQTPADISDQITHWFRCKITSGALKIDPQKIKDGRFFNKEEMKKLPIWPATKKFFNQYIFKSDFL